MYCGKISCNVAAKIMGISGMKLAMHLRENSPIYPVGVAIPPKYKGGKWDYHIVPAKLAGFLGISVSDLEEELEKVKLAGREDEYAKNYN